MLELHQKGFFNVLIKDLRLHNHEYISKSFQTNRTIFELLFSWVGLYIRKSSLRCEVATPTEAVYVTLRDIWLLEMLILQLEFLKEYTVGRIIVETTQVIWKCLVKKVYMNAPRSECEWREISAEFKKRWNFPHCIGAIDGMHFIFILCT